MNRPIKKSKEVEKAIKTIKQMTEGKGTPTRVTKAMETFKLSSKDFMSRFTRFAIANEAYFEFLMYFFTSWKMHVTELENEEIDNYSFAFDLIQAHEDQAKALESTIRKLSGEDRRIMDAFVVESYPFYIQYLEIDLMKDNDFIKTTSNSLEAFHGFVKLAQNAELRKELIITEKKAAEFKELVLLSELKLAEAKIKMARYAS